MNRRRRLAAGVPLAVLAGGGALFGCLLAVSASAAVWAWQGRLHVDLTAVATGFVVAGAVGGCAALAAGRHAQALRRLRGKALVRLGEGDGDAQDAFRPGRSSLEVDELARTLDALQVRVRVADEVAERHRRSAETASAGMFELLSGLVAAEEGARGQLAAELHDTVAQTLMVTRARLEDAQRPEEVALAAELVQEAEDQVRAVMARTRPPALRDGDLARAVAMLRDDLGLRYGLNVRIEWPAEPYPLPLATAVTVYRFFQEALLNVVKHADVDEAVATLSMGDEGVVATVQDDGPGFDPADVRSDRGRHVGLGLLRERARLAGGSLDVTSWPHDGTELTLRLPAGSAVSAGSLPRAVGH